LARAPILIDKFLADAIEVDVEVVADFGPEADQPRVLVAGVMEHIEEAGIHSGDSACSLPPHFLDEQTVRRIKDQSRRLAEALKVRGLMNVQYAIRRPANEGEEFAIYVLEVNPRASRTVPFVSKATGVGWARIAAKVVAGQQLVDLDDAREVTPTHTSVKESVFPFNKFPGVDVILGPEMRSTGEVMGIDPCFSIAFAKAEMAAGNLLPTEGTVLLTVRDSDKPFIVDMARQLLAMEFNVVATSGTHRYLGEHGVHTRRVKKIKEGRPNAIDLMKNNELALLFNTPVRKGIQTDEGHLRSIAVRFNVPIVTTTTAIAITVRAIAVQRERSWSVRSLQEFFPSPEPASTAGP